MSEQEVQWGEWERGHPCPFRFGSPQGLQYADASYLNALEREVRDLRAYKVLADKAFGGAFDDWYVDTAEGVACKFCYSSALISEAIEHEAICPKLEYDSLPSTSEGEGK